MRIRVAGVVFLLAGVLALSGTALAINVTPTTDGDTLAGALVGAGTSISNVTFVGGSGTSGIPFSAGAFTSGGVGIDTGIILTTGNVALEDGVNSSDSSAGEIGNSAVTDTDLEGLIPQDITDKTVLEFDFTTDSDSIFFSYVFASEEYNEFTNTGFNDVFGFFLSGNGLSSTNIALIPGTSTPVSINNVNGGNPELGEDPTPHNAQFFNNNDLSDGGGAIATEYDGFTDVFTASATGLTPGATYHLKLGIADAGDTDYDSAVFLKAGSFSSEPPPVTSVPEPATLVLMGSGLLCLSSIVRRRGKKS